MYMHRALLFYLSNSPEKARGRYAQPRLASQPSCALSQAQKRCKPVGIRKYLPSGHRTRGQSEERVCPLIGENSMEHLERTTLLAQPQTMRLSKALRLTLFHQI